MEKYDFGEWMVAIILILMCFFTAVGLIDAVARYF